MSRTSFTAAVVVLLALGILSDARPAHGDPLPDAIPTWWHEAAGLTPLLTAPPPPNPATICIIDTGVTPTPDLDISARWAYDGGTLDDVHATEDSPGHGTVVAHFAAAAVNGWGGAGAFPHARISSVRVFPKDGGAAWQDYIRGITRCLKLDANTKVIVISIGGQTIEPGEADELEAHIEQARNLYDVNVVASAGNTGGSVDYPGRFDAAFTVTAVGADGRLCDFAARGFGADIAAPGCGLLQSGWTGGAWQLDGTSFAAPMVAAALAAMRSDAPISAVAAERLLLEKAAAGDPPMLRARELLDSLAKTGAVDRELQPKAQLAPPRDAPAQITESQLPPPLVAASRRGSRIQLEAANRPPRVRFQVRMRARTLTRRSDRLVFKTHARRAICRFLAGSHRSSWTSVRW